VTVENPSRGKQIGSARPVHGPALEMNQTEPSLGEKPKQPANAPAMRSNQTSPVALIFALSGPHANRISS